MKSFKALWGFAVYIFLITLSFKGFAEGSKDLITNGGQRAFLYSSTVNSLPYNPFPTLGIVKVYAKAGETIYMGSSAQGYGNGTIIAKAPNGASYNSGTGGGNLIGRIDNITEEQAGPLPNAGGYDAYTRTVQAGEEGVWEISFISPDQTLGAGSYPGDLNATAAWTQSSTTSYISAFDVTVRDAGGFFLTGRTYMNVFGGSLSDEDALFYAKFKILTKDGYIYEVDNNGQAGFIFVFFVNNKGFRDGSNNASYASVGSSTNPPVHDPRTADTGTDITHKIFFNQPNTDLPTSANIAGGGTTWLLNPLSSPTVTDFLFTGIEGTLYRGGIYPMGGNITFNASHAMDYFINLDINKNGSFTDGVDVSLTGTSVIGNNTRYWNGLDGLGNTITGNLSFSPSNMKISLRGGEIHFPFIDVENNVNGIIIKRTNGIGSPNDIVYWDDNVTGITGGTTNLTGSSSTANGHKWGSVAYSATAFGNEEGLDTWTYVESSPVNPLMNVSLSQADLEVVSISSNKATYCVGEEITYTVQLRNTGPDDVTGAIFAFNYPNGFNFLSVTPVQTTGVSTIYNNSSNSTQFNATVDIEDDAVLTLTIKGTMSVSGNLNTVSSSIMRPADVTDPDATNPDTAAPTDPLDECNSGTAGCNNIKTATAVTITTRAITIQNATVTEGTGIVKNISFPISIPAIASCDVSVNYTVTHTTTNAADFDGTVLFTGTATIPAGATSTNLLFPLNTDKIIEGNETFTVTLSNPVGGTLNNLSAVGTIENDDTGAITVTKTDGAETGTVPGSFIFSFPSGVTSDVNTEIDYTLAGTSVAGTDYTHSATSTGTVIILAGTNSITLSLPVVDDAIVEGSETVTIALTRLFNSHSGTVTNNSPVTPIVSIADNDVGILTLSSDITLNETNSGTVTVTFTLTLDKATGSFFTLNYATANGTALSADNDYAASGSVQLNFNGTAGESKTINITINGDTKIEATELLTLALSNLSDSFSGRLTIPVLTRTVTITNDDAGAITITKTNGEEGVQSGSFVFSYPAGLTTDVPVDINYTLTGTANGAGTDYTGAVTGTATIPAGQNSVTLNLPVMDDAITEGTETVTVTAATAANTYGIVVANSPQTINIVDNDNSLLTISPVTLNESHTGTTTASFTLTLNNATTTGFTVGYTTSDGTATTADADYITPAAGSVLTFSGTVGETKTIQIIINGDRKVEATELFNILLSTPSDTFSNRLTLQSTTATGTITNDDSGVITITKTDGAETGPVNGSYIFSFPAGFISDQPTTINYTLTGTAAGSGADYTASSVNSIIIPASQNSVTLNLTVNDDAIIEGDETVSLTGVSISSIYAGITLNPVIPVVTITDNDNAILTLSAPVTLNEGDNGTVTATYTLTLDKATTSGFTINYATADGTALVSDNDYVSNAGTLSFTGSAGESKTIAVIISGDTQIEPGETFSLSLSGLSNNFSNRLIVPVTSTGGTITNDDAATITITKSDGSEGSFDGSFTFSYPSGVVSDLPIDINYTLTGSATGTGTDYTGTITGTVTIPAGSNSVSLNIPVIDDAVTEGTETVIITATVAANAYGIVVANSPQTINISDNDNSHLTISPVILNEGHTGTTTASFTVTLNNATAGSFTLGYSTSDGTATTADTDYIAPAGGSVLSFSGTAGETQTISISINGDRKVEATELFNILLGTLSTTFSNRLTLQSTTTTGTITNDDSGLITITRTDGAETGPITGSYIFSFPAGFSSDQPTTINYTLTGTASGSGTDYSPSAAGSIIIPAGQSSVTLNLSVIDDMIIEGDETVSLSGITINSIYAGVTLNPVIPTVTLTDNDNATLTLSAPVTLNEGDNGTVTATYTLTLDKATTSGFTINYATANGTALLADNDYVSGSGTLSFTGTAGESKTITVIINGDIQIEPNETFALNISGLSNNFNTRLTVPVTTVGGTITNDDAATITITRSDGSEGSYNGSFTFSYPAGVLSDQPTTVNYTLTGTANGAGTDYTGAVTGTVTIPAGSNSVTLNIPVIEDAIIEDTETVIITTGTVTSPYGFVVSNSPHSLNILDNDDAVLTISSPVSITESNAGTVTATFNVTLNRATANSFTVNYATSDGTATTANADYVANTGTINFAGTAGEVQTINITVNGDLNIEADETFNILLSALSNNFNNRLTIPQTTALGRILNDDGGGISVTSTNGAEAGTVPGTFIFSFPAGFTTDQPTIINYTLAGNAQSVSDYTGVTSGTVTIPAFSNSVTLTLPVTDDAVTEDNETIEINTGTVSSPYNFTVANTFQSLTIADNDNATLTLSGPVAVIEGNSGTADAVFTVTLDKATTSGFTINYATVDGTALVGDNDYLPGSGTLSFTGTAGESKTVTVKVNGDTKIEANETFLVNLIGLSNTFNNRLTVPVNSNTGNISNDDSGAITITGADGEEGVQGGRFVFSFPAGVTADVVTSINYNLTGTAVGAGTDYSGAISGTITIGAGQNSATLNLPVIDDSILEETETVILTSGTITSPYGVTAANSTQTINILDNDNATLSISNITLAEGNTGSSTATFTVTLNRATGSTFTLNYATANGTAATADADYVSKTGTISFAGTAGETQTISIDVTSDRKIENDETFSILLSGLSNTFTNRLTLPSITATATIINDDAGVISITPTNGSETGPNPGTFIFAFPAGYSADQPTTINYTLNGTALSGGADYTGATSGTVVIPAGQNSITLGLPVTDDAIVEESETITLTSGTVTSIYGLTVVNSPQSLMISDNDNATLAISGPVTVTEGTSGTVDAIFTVILDKATTSSFTINYATGNGTALVGDNDYLPGSGTLSFIGTAGESKTITVRVNGDTKIEANETFVVNLLGLNNTFNNRLSIPINSSTGSITNDDSGVITITRTDGEEGVQGGRFVFSFPAGVTADIATAVNYTLGGTAASGGVDHTGATPGTITIPAGANSVTLNLPVIDDSIIEDTETINITASSATNAYGISISNPTESINILDNDAALLTVGPASISEGHTGIQNLNFTVTLNRATRSAFTVGYSTSDGTAAIADEDYLAAATGAALSFAGTAGETQTISIAVNGDKKIEADEIFNVTLSNLSNTFGNRLTIQTGTATGTITNDDSGSVTITTTDASENGPVAGTFIFSFPSGVSSDKSTTINYSLGGTAGGNGQDYTGTTSGSITIPAGANSVSLTFPVIDDTIVEGDELIAVTNAGINSTYTGVTMNPAHPSLTVADNDAATLILSNDVVLTEGHSGTVNATFTLTLDKSTTSAFTINYSTTDGTALTGDNDYVSGGGTLGFAGTAGETKTITITINGDTKIEANELFNLALGNLSNTFGNRLTIPVPTRKVTLNNDDSGEITITRIHGQEGIQGGSFIFSFLPGSRSDIPVVINYTLSGTAASGGIDYTGTTPGTITIPAGANSVTLNLPVIDDNVIEDTETVDITASPVSNVYGINISDPSESINILDNDNAVLTIAPAGITEGNNGAAQSLNFTVTLNRATRSGFTVSYSTSDGTATTADVDYSAAALNSTLSFAGTAGETQTISIAVNGDRKIEADEAFNVILNNLSNTFNNRLTLLVPTAIGTIINDDTGVITVTKTDGSETGPVPGTFVFSLQSGITSDASTTINYTLNGVAGGNGQDYTGTTSGSVFIPAGANSVALALPVIDDAIIEGSETVTIAVTSLNSVHSNSITSDPALPIVTIADNDFATLTLSRPVRLSEGNNGATAFNFTVTLDKGTNAPFTVNYSTSDGTASIADNDYIPLNNIPLSFAGTIGETKTITVQVTGDLKTEADETFSLSLGSLSTTFGDRLKIQGSPVMGTIVNDDAAIITVTKNDGTEGSQNGSFVFSFPQGVSSDAPTVINYLLGGSATSADYTSLATNSITIPAGANSVTLNLPVIDDDVLEEPEAVTITLTNISNIHDNLLWVQPLPVLTIFDNDNASIIVSEPTAVAEGNTGTIAVTFTVVLNKLVSSAFDIDYTTVNGTATAADNDYAFKAGRLSFAGFAGESKRITILVNGDTRVEDVETFDLILDGLNPSFAGRLAIQGSPAVATVLNDDVVPVAVSDVATTSEDTPITFSIVSNDSDADGIDPATITLTSLPVKGTLKANTDGTITYTPVLNDYGSYRLTYTIKDIYGLISNEATVIINVIPVNDPPVAENDVFYVFKDVDKRAAVSANDSDPDADVLRFRLLTSPQKGQLQFFNQTDGTFIYTPQAGFAGTDGFTYETNDPSGLTDQADVTLNVQPNVTVNLTPLTGTITEGDSIMVTAELNEPLLQDVTVNLSYSGSAANNTIYNGPAQDNTDYIITQNYQSITIPPGQTTTTQKVAVISLKDYLKEDDETIEVRIAAVTPSAFVSVGNGSDIIIKNFYPEEKPADKDANADISPDPLTSPNGDGLGNEKFVIHNIEKYPDNEVTIFNRWGNEVYRIEGYNNSDKSFTGIANTGLLANTNATLVDGVYYFIIYTKISTGEKKMNKGYVIIKR